LTRCHFIKPSALSSLVEQVEDSVLKAAMTERWQVIQAKKLALEKPSIRPPGMKTLVMSRPVGSIDEYQFSEKERQ
jgi:hypothetical protein